MRDRLLSIFSGAALLLLVFVSGCAHYDKTALSNEGGSGWPVPLHDYMRTNATGDKLSPPLALGWEARASRLWAFPDVFPETEPLAPVLGDGIIYVASSSGMISAYELPNGAPVWSHDAKASIEGAPAAGQGFVCFGTGKGVLRCLDQKTGELEWEFPSRSAVLSSPIIINDSVFFATADDRVYAVELKTGKKAWSYSRPKPRSPVAFGSRASIAYADERLFVHFMDGTLVSLKADGEEAWARPLVKDLLRAQRARRTPLLNNGSVFAINDDGFLASFDAMTGEPKTVFKELKAVDFLVGADKLIVVGQESAVAFDAKSGERAWDAPLKYLGAIGAAGAKDGFVVLSNYTHKRLGMDYFTASRTGVQAFSYDGSPIWDHSARSTVSSGPAISSGVMAIINDDGKIRVLR